jgi:hypothetical protein
MILNRLARAEDADDLQAIEDRRDEQTKPRSGHWIIVPRHKPQSQAIPPLIPIQQ